MEIAGRIGSKQDFEWLFEMLSAANSEDEQKFVSTAITKIARTCSARFLYNWTEKIEKDANSSALIQQKGQWLGTMLETAENKAQTEQDTALLMSIRSKLAVIATEADRQANATVRIRW